MARLFLSHSSANDAQAVALADWLVRNGWDDFFLDVDEERGLLPGERWQKALKAAADRCEAVLFLLSRAWLASQWCLAELSLAHLLGKQLFGVLIEELPPQDLPRSLTQEWQLVNLAGAGESRSFRVRPPRTAQDVEVAFSAEGLARLKAGLEKAGLDARSFAWPPAGDPDRPPYRGLRPLEAEDAGIFFGRDAQTVGALDRLRGLREKGGGQVFVLLGASGAGKSSFMRAGLLPRLARDDRHFEMLPVIRPGKAALWGDQGLLESLCRAFAKRKPPRPRAELREAIRTGPTALVRLLDALRERPWQLPRTGDAPVKAPTLVIPIDQGEELFAVEGQLEAARFLELLAELLRSGGDAVVLVAIRSDIYERLQHAPALEGIPQEPFSLPPMLRAAYKDVIEGPARRLEGERRLEIDPTLTEALLADIATDAGRGSLPLLSFTLERLYLEYGARGRLELDDYGRMGGITGSIEAAVERALESAAGDPRVPRQREEQLALLRRAFIPWLATIDDETERPRRRVAQWDEIPVPSRPLMERLVEERVLVRDVRDKVVTIEPAHESLLWHWPALKGWIAEERETLTALAGVMRAAGDWNQHGRSEDWLAHKGVRLQDALDLVRDRPDLADALGDLGHAYLTACRAREDEERRREEIRLKTEAEAAREKAEAALRLARRTRIALVVILFLGVLAAGGWVYASRQADEVRQQAAAAAYRAALQQQQNGYDETTLAHLAKAIRLDPGNEGVATAILMLLSSRYWPSLARPDLTHEGLVLSAHFSPDGTRVATASEDFSARVWDARTGQAIGAPLQHQALVFGARFSPDGTRVVTASNDDTARIWDARTGEPTSPPLQHEGWITVARFSPDGKRVLTASFDRTARRWDAHTGEPLGSPLRHEGWVSDAQFDPDGQRIVTAAYPSDNAAHVWDPASGRPIGPPLRHAEGVRTAEFSPDGRRVVTASNDFTARVWDVDTGEPVGLPLRHRNRAYTAEFSPDGTRVVTASTDHTARIWDARTGEPLGAPLRHLREVKSAKFSPDGTRVVTASEDGTARVWDAASGRPLGAPLRHQGIVAGAEFSPDGEWLVTASDDHTARIWPARTGQARPAPFRHQAPVTAAEYSPDGTRVVTAAADGTARVRDAVTGAATGKPVRHDGRIHTASFSPDGTRIATASEDGTARVWDSRTGDPVGKPLRHQGPVYGAEFSRDGTRVVTASKDGTARVWDARTGEPLGEPMGRKDAQKDAIRSAGFSPDGTRVVTAPNDHTARIWDPLTGKAIGKPLQHAKGINSARFSRDGRLIVTASDDQTARFWNALTGEPVGEPLQHQGPVYGAEFSPDGTRVVTASKDGAARVWATDTGQLVGALLQHDESVVRAEFSPDGQRVVTASADGTARLWDANTGRPIGILLRHSAPVNRARFSPDGRSVVTASDDGTARIWRISKPEPDQAGVLPDLAEAVGRLTISNLGAVVAFRHREQAIARLQARLEKRETRTDLGRILQDLFSTETSNP